MQSCKPIFFSLEEGRPVYSPLLSAKGNCGCEVPNYLVWWLARGPAFIDKELLVTCIVYSCIGAHSTFTGLMVYTATRHVQQQYWWGVAQELFSSFKRSCSEGNLSALCNLTLWQTKLELQKCLFYWWCTEHNGDMVQLSQLLECHSFQQAQKCSCCGM